MRRAGGSTGPTRRLVVAMVGAVLLVLAGSAVAGDSTGQTVRVSVSSFGAQGLAGDSVTLGFPRIAISGDGRYVGFATTASTLVGADTNGGSDVFVHDTFASVTSRVSLRNSGGQSGRGGLWPSLSQDGRYVAFVSASTDLIPVDLNRASDVFIRDRVGGTTTRASVRTGAGR
jgi:hypothetical protein